MFVLMGPYRHEMCRKKGSGSIARAQKDESIREVYATRVSCCASRRTCGEQRAKSDSESTRSSSIIFFRLSNFWLVTPGHFHQDSYPLWIYENVPKIVFQEGLHHFFRPKRGFC